MPGREPSVFLITAEHASAAVPARWRPLFAGSPSVLSTHRAWDPGSRLLAQALASGLGAELLQGEVSRLLVDLNRSIRHPALWSEFSRRLPETDRQELLDRYWRPHWQRYRQRLESATLPVLHLACHSFTPVLNGRLRQADVGLLYDPSRTAERDFACRLKQALAQRLPALRVRMNYPYRGVANGLGQQHRRLFGQDRLITLEIEVNSVLFERQDASGLVSSLVEGVRQASGCR
ncbi:MAG: N-formylglutamate amidohydrolase [Wenzhouxiangella sp.]